MFRTARILGSIAALLLTAAAMAEPPSQAPKTGKDWKSLWDAKTLTGWKPAKYYGAGKVAVRDGAIIIERGKVMNGVVYTRGDFPKMDYELRFDAKKIDGRDFFGTATFPVGSSFCTFVVGGWGGTTVGLSNIDYMDASENQTSTSKDFTTGRWYHIRIRVSAHRIETWIDREKLVDFDTTDRKIGIRIECNACKPFGIATYMTTSAIRNIRVRPLTEKEKEAISHARQEKTEK
jgi:hypothetical protein